MYVFAISALRQILLQKSLIQELVLKDLRIRYLRTKLGLFWVFLSPFLTVGIFYVIFSKVLKANIQEAPFILYLMTAVFPWSFLSSSLISSTTSLIDNKNLIRDSNFAHYLIPISIVLTNFLIFLPSLVLIILISLFVLKGLPLTIIFLPVVLFVHILITAGLSIIFSIIYVKRRDIRYILESLLTLLFYLTPVFYSLSLIKKSFPGPLFKIYIYNPFVGLMNLYRLVLLKGFYAFVQKDIDALNLIFIPVGFCILSLIGGFYLYKRSKSRINDYLFY